MYNNLEQKLKALDKNVLCGESQMSSIEILVRRAIRSYDFVKKKKLEIKRWVEDSHTKNLKTVRSCQQAMTEVKIL